MKRCSWCNLDNPKYVTYHDQEWGVLNLEDSYLFEMLLLESFQAGLSWECVLNKRDSFRDAFDQFDYQKIATYQDNKVFELKNNPKIIRNSLKIKASVENAKIFQDIQKEFGSFASYLKTFWNGNVLYENTVTTNTLSDQISKDLKMRGMKYVGSTIIYSFLQAIGIINSHLKDCDFYQGG